MQTQKAIELLKKTMLEHGLSTWKAQLNPKFTRIFGQCNLKTRTLQLSRKLVEINSEERVMKTILHEIAHALTPFQSHNQKWKNVCRAIGGDGIARYTRENTNIIGDIHLPIESATVNKARVYTWTNKKGQVVTITESYL